MSFLKCGKNYALSVLCYSIFKSKICRLDFQQVSTLSFGFRFPQLKSIYRLLITVWWTTNHYQHAIAKFHGKHIRIHLTLYFDMLRPEQNGLQFPDNIKLRLIFYPRRVLAYKYCHFMHLCVCLHLCVKHKLFRAITHDQFKLGSPPNLDQRYKTPWLRSLFFVYMCAGMGGMSSIDLDIKKFTQFYPILSLKFFLAIICYLLWSLNLNQMCKTWLRSQLFWRWPLHHSFTVSTIWV